MPTIKFYQDLRVIRNLLIQQWKSISFQKFSLQKNVILLQIKYEDPYAQFQPISVKHGAKRKYEKSLFQNLQILKARQEQTQTWLQFERSCEYINEKQFKILNNQYNQIIGMLVNMMIQSPTWCTFSSIKEEK